MWAARKLHEAGGRIIAVSDVDSAVYNEAGLDIPDLAAHCYSRHQLLQTFPGGAAIPREDSSFLATPCDVVVTAALGGSLNAATAPKLDCKVCNAYQPWFP